MSEDTKPSRSEIEKECRDDIYSGMTMGVTVATMVGGGIGFLLAGPPRSSNRRYDKRWTW